MPACSFDLKNVQSGRLEGASRRAGHGNIFKIRIDFDWPRLAMNRVLK